MQTEEKEEEEEGGVSTIGREERMEVMNVACRHARATPTFVPPLHACRCKMTRGKRRHAFCHQKATPRSSVPCQTVVPVHMHTACLIILFYVVRHRKGVACLPAFSKSCPLFLCLFNEQREKERA